MGRLTRIFEKDNQKYVCIDVCGKKCVEGYSECHDCEPFTNVMKKLAEYENLEEQGLLIKLPFSVGTKVYEIIEDCTSNACVKDEEVGCENCEYLKKKAFPRHYMSPELIVFNMHKFGKTIFLTKAEAEKALEKMGK